MCKKNIYACAFKAWDLKSAIRNGKVAQREKTSVQLSAKRAYQCVALSESHNPPPCTCTDRNNEHLSRSKPSTHLQSSTLK